MKNLKIHRDKGPKIQINIHDFTIGGDEKIIISGPCAIESYEQMDEIAKNLKAMGVHMLRGGAFKPRTSPYDFQGLGEEGLKILKEIGEKYDMPIITEILDPRDIETYKDYMDIIQIGSRNMYNYSLLKEVGRQEKPVLLKRGISANIKEWLMAAEYIVNEGNEKVILCERGIRSFETITRNTLDLNAVAYVKENFRLPIIVDPSHGTGLRELVKNMSIAGLCAGGDGLIIESHINPDKAISDARQTISMETLKNIVTCIKNMENVGVFTQL